MVIKETAPSLVSAYCELMVTAQKLLNRLLSESTQRACDEDGSRVGMNRVLNDLPPPIAVCSLRGSLQRWQTWNYRLCRCTYEICGTAYRASSLAAFIVIEG